MGQPTRGWSRTPGAAAAGAKVASGPGLEVAAFTHADGEESMEEAAAT